MLEYSGQLYRWMYLAATVLVTLLVYLPVWIITSVPRFMRPRPSWSFKRALMVRAVARMIATENKVGKLFESPTHLAVAEGPDVNAAWVDPTPRLVVGDIKTLAEAAAVQYIHIPGYWYYRPGETMPVGAPPTPGEKVVYALHGGAFHVLSAAPSSLPATIARGMVQHLPNVRRVFALEYRLSTAAPLEPSHPFPTALVDAIAGYNYLVNVVGFGPTDIILEGDSAGGNLALALTRYLIENKNALCEAAEETNMRTLSSPSSLVLNSPWVDLSNSHDKRPTSYLQCSDVFLSDNTLGMQPEILKYGACAYTGVHGMYLADFNAYVSAGSKHVEASYKGWPRTFITSGGAEWLIDSIRLLKERMSADMGEGTGPGQLCYHEGQDLPHNYLANTWCEPERTKALQALAAWA